MKYYVHKNWEQLIGVDNTNSMVFIKDGHEYITTFHNDGKVYRHTLTAQAIEMNYPMASNNINSATREQAMAVIRQIFFKLALKHKEIQTNMNNMLDEMQNIG